MNFTSVIYSVIIPITCCIGIVGNVLTLIVIGKRVSQSSMYGYLSCLSSSDLSYLIFTLLECYFFSSKYESKQGQTAIWVALNPMSNVLKASSDFVTLWMTLDRCSVISSIGTPQATSSKSLFTLSFQFGAIFFLSVILALPGFFEYDIVPEKNLESDLEDAFNETDDNAATQIATRFPPLTRPLWSSYAPPTFVAYTHTKSEATDTKVWRGFQYFYMVAVKMLLPMGILVGNLYIVFKLRRVNKDREKWKITHGVSSSVNMDPNDSSQEKDRVKLLLLIVSTYFLLTMPSNTIFIYWTTHYNLTLDTAPMHLLVVTQLFHFFEVANYSSNFYLYCITNLTLEDLEEKLVPKFLCKSKTKRKISGTVCESHC